MEDERMVNTELYRMFLRRNFKFSFGVSIGVGIVSYVLTVLFPQMDQRAAQVVSSTWPAVMKSLFGDPAQAFADVYGWMNLEMFHITFWAAFGLLAAILASRVISREREERTLEILLAYPVSRSSIVVSRIMGIITLLALAVVPSVLAFVLAIVTLGQELNFGVILFASGTGLLLALFCAAVTLLASAVGAGQTLSTFVALGVVFVLFLLSSVLVKLIPALGILDIVSPFNVYRVDDALVDGLIDPSVLYLLAYDSIPAIVAVLIFTRRDIVV
jgi:ABC-2 type transport system permease protein